MNIVDVLRIKFPDIDLYQDLVLRDYSDGKGPFIAEWYRDEPKPEKKQILQWMAETEVVSKYEEEQKLILNAPILDRLEDIDLKTIRSLREAVIGNVDAIAKLQALDQEAQNIRVELSAPEEIK